MASGGGEGKGLELGLGLACCAPDLTASAASCAALPMMGAADLAPETPSSTAPLATPPATAPTCPATREASSNERIWGGGGGVGRGLGGG